MISNPKMIIGTEFLSRQNLNIEFLREYFDYALKNNFNEIDTAYSYGENNSVEKILGEVLKEDRKKFIISSKFLKINKDNRTPIIKTLDDIKYSVESSLKNLKTNYLDIYYFHSGSNEQFFNDPIWNYLNNLKKQRVIIDLGLSIKNDLILKNSLQQIDFLKQYGISKVQFVFNMLSDQAKYELIPKLNKMDIEFFGRMPYAKGFLINNYIFEHSIEEISNKFNEIKMIENAVNIKKNFKKLEKKDAINYCLNSVKKVILASSNLNQLKENINIFKEI